MTCLPRLIDLIESRDNFDLNLFGYIKRSLIKTKKIMTKKIMSKTSFLWQTLLGELRWWQSYVRYRNEIWYYLEIENVFTSVSFYISDIFWNVFTAWNIAPNSNDCLKLLFTNGLYK